MKKNEPKYLKLYKEWMEAGKMPEPGLCAKFSDVFGWTLKKYPHFDLIKPDDREKIRLDINGLAPSYWGSDSSQELKYIFTPLRQNLVLLMAALNNEL